MTPDVFVVVGIACIGLALLSFLNAFTHGTLPKVALVMMTLGGGLIVYANHVRPGGYRFDDLPAAFARVLGQLVG